MTVSARAFAPGRTEIAGNHTDHQGGRVIAAAVDCGIEVAVRANGTNRARVESDGFAPVDISLDSLQPVEAERGTTASLVRGVAAGLRASGVAADGFDAKVTSTVPSGGGLSSSAAFELALACALCESAGGGTVLQPVALAKIGQAAERDYFGKPCGLMDQLAVALGGIAAIDFEDEESPAVDLIDFDFASCGYALCLIDSHCDHSLYTDEYAQVALDMFDVARLFSAQRLSQVTEEAFMSRFEEVRTTLGDVPALRALHYYHENHLVDARSRALHAGDVQAFLRFTRQSGASSAQYLQNVSTFDRASQPAMVALALADKFLEGEGACRIHGGGFGGSVQAFVPAERADAFARDMDAHLGEGSCHVYRMGCPGAHVL